MLAYDKSLPYEGYLLDVTPSKVLIAASSERGFRYAFATLSLLLPKEFFGDKRTQEKPTIPCVKIDDYPRFSYRGFHLDVARHFIPADEVKKLIDIAALFKLNRFHWHLSDDQGWRVEIKRYPLLTEIGSKRDQTIEGTWDYYFPERYDGKPYGGYYTQDQVKDVVRYAQDRGVTIIPEIDMPGHASAAITAYPFLSCDPAKQYKVAGKWGIFEDVLCPKEETFEFIDNVMVELTQLFPSEYIHVRGDECPKAAWEKSPYCQELIKKEGLKDENELQAYFMKRCEQIVKKYGRRIIGWDEIADEEIPQDAVVMAWRGSGHGAITAANKGNDVIMNPSAYYYFDYNQEDPANAPLSIGGLTALKMVYNYNPVPDTMGINVIKHTIGIQANLWTEYIPDAKKAQYMMYPRLTALAESAWTADSRKNWDDYTARLGEVFKRLDELGINACRNYYEPTFASQWNSKTNKLDITLAVMYPDAVIYYTTDGSEPSEKSTRYTSPIHLAANTVVKAKSFSKNKPLSKTISKTYTVNKATGKNYTASSEGHAMDWYDVSHHIINDGRYGIIPDNRGWLTFGKDSVTLTFDLEKSEDISRLVVGITRSPINNVWGIDKVICSFSADGIHFGNEAEMKFSYPEFEGKKEINRQTFDLSKQQARYVRLTFIGASKAPDNYPYPNVKPGIAMDEIEIY